MGRIFREKTAGGNWASESKVIFHFDPFETPVSGDRFQSAGLHPSDRTAQEFEKGGLQNISAQ